MFDTVASFFSNAPFSFAAAIAAAAPYHRHSSPLLFIESRVVLCRCQEYCSDISLLITLCSFRGLLVDTATAKKRRRQRKCSPLPPAATRRLTVRLTQTRRRLARARADV